MFRLSTLDPIFVGQTHKRPKNIKPIITLAESNLHTIMEGLVALLRLMIFITTLLFYSQLCLIAFMTTLCYIEQIRV